MAAPPAPSSLEARLEVCPEARLEAHLEALLEAHLEARLEACLEARPEARSSRASSVRCAGAPCRFDSTLHLTAESGFTVLYYLIYIILFKEAHVGCCSACVMHHVTGSTVVLRSVRTGGGGRSAAGPPAALS